MILLCGHSLKWRDCNDQIGTEYAGLEMGAQCQPPRGSQSRGNKVTCPSAAQVMLLTLKNQYLQMGLKKDIVLGVPIPRRDWDISYK
jgi:hypothetical protein